MVKLSECFARRLKDDPGIRTAPTARRQIRDDRADSIRGIFSRL
jgi:hypothetical protein